MKKFIVGAACALLSMVTNAGIVEDIAADPEFLNAEISPTGEYLAALKEIDNKRTVVVFKFPSMEPAGVMRFPGRNEVGNFMWVNDERIVASIVTQFDRLEAEQSRGELFAMNADGSKSEYLFGYRATEEQGSGHIKRRTREWASASIVDPLWHDDKQALIQISSWTAGYSSVQETALINVYTGRIRNRVKGPVTNAQLITNAQGEVRLSASVDDDFNTVFHIRDAKTKKWRELAKISYGETGIEPVLLKNDEQLIAMLQPDGKPRGLYEINLSTMEREEILQHDVVDVRERIDFNNRLYGAQFYDGVPSFTAIDESHPHTQLVQSMEQTFKGRYPFITSSTHDYNRSIIGVADDNHTTEYYIYDRTSNQLQLLFDEKPFLDDTKLGTAEPVTITARDGLELHGYLTLPPGSDGQNMPFVIVPHGGPHGPRDHWWHGWEDFIPASGYAMLRVNYRGSGGYGTAFEKKGFGEWPGAMQDDLTDSVRWAIEEGIADPERICIFGWSYGGYAAAMSITREPDLYKCSAAGAGALDLEEQYRNSDFAADTRWGHKYLDKVIGPTKEDRIAASPITHVAKVKTPVLLIHGEEDARVTVENSRRYAEALKKVGGPLYKYIELPNEPHSPSNPKNWTRVMVEVVDFLKAHIGPGSFAPEA